MTPLHYAARWEHRDVAELLLANNAQVNARDSKGNTPLQSVVDKCVEKLAVVTIKCDGCGTTYKPGYNAICVTADQAAASIGRAALRAGVNMVLAHARLEEMNLVVFQKNTILHNARKGWTCHECQTDNVWWPDLFNGMVELLRQHGGHE